MKNKRRDGLDVGRSRPNAAVDQQLPMSERCMHHLLNAWFCWSPLDERKDFENRVARLSEAGWGVYTILKFWYTSIRV